MNTMNKTFFAPQLYIKKGTRDISFYEKAFGAIELMKFTKLRRFRPFRLGQNDSDESKHNRAPKSQGRLNAANICGQARHRQSKNRRIGYNWPIGFDISMSSGE